MSTNSTRGFWVLRDIPVVLWLMATLVVAVAHPYIPVARWLLIHLLMLGAVTHAIFVWSRYFTDALLHTPDEGRRGQNRRLLLLNLGVLFVVTGVVINVWLVTLLGATAVAVAVLWHGGVIAAQFRVALPSRFGFAVRYYLAAACFLPIGAALGAILARELADPWQDRLVVAHVAVNLLGWIGLTVVGTLLTLWPTMLRTQIATGAERAAAQALPVLVTSALVVAVGATVGLRLVAVAGIAGYLVGLFLSARAFVDALRRKPPKEFAPWSVLAGMAWLVGMLVATGFEMAVADSWQQVGDAFDLLTPFLVVGFGAQLLLGALSYLIPVALGGGPLPVRAASNVLNQGTPLRIVAANGGLILAVLPTPDAVRSLALTVAASTLAVTLVLLFFALRASRRAKQQPKESGRDRDFAARTRPTGQAAGFAGVGVAALAMVVAVGVAINPAALHDGSSSAAGVRATGKTTVVAVEAHDMRYTPDHIVVPVGNRLVIKLTNTDTALVHDLVVDSGARTARLAPGGSELLDVGVVGRAIDGWCSVLGHRQMGMVLTIDVAGSAAQSPTTTSHDDSMPAAMPVRDAALGPAPSSTAHRRTFVVRDVTREVAPGVTQRLWTYNGTAPGPVLHGRVGDRFVITLVNHGSMGHSIDFHAGSLAPQRPMRTIAPGQSLTYRFTATKAGIWMYHCSTMPMSAHIANGLFGAVVIEPPNLPRVDRSYVLVQSEYYLGAHGGVVDVEKLNAEEPDLVVFNGSANQYDHHPLRARVGERVRVWVLDAGPDRPTSFHVVGGQFDTTYLEGAYLLRGGPGGAQSLGLQPAQGGFVELTFPEAGDYPFVSHLMIDAERGAHGMFHVTP